MNPAEVRAGRMHSLLLGERTPRTPLEVAEWFGALQAQDAASGHWSLGVRCPGFDEQGVLDAFESGEIVRTWPMRGTIHIVPGRDVRWMLELTGSRMLAGAARRRENLGLTERDAIEAAEALGTALRPSQCLTRAEALAAIEQAGISTAGQRGYHLLWFAAQSGVTCIGPQRGSDQTFVLLDAWLPPQAELARGDALAELLFRYVRSHGPVPLSDFVGWTGLTMGDARAAAAANAGRLEPIGVGKGAMWATTELAGLIAAGDLPSSGVHALPGFDEFMLGYKDRSAMLPEGAFERVVPGGNGVFRATVVVDGSAAATWTRKVTKDRIDITAEPFSPISPEAREAAEQRFAEHAAFLGRSANVEWSG